VDNNIWNNADRNKKPDSEYGKQVIQLGKKYGVTRESVIAQLALAGYRPIDIVNMLRETE